MANLTSFNTVKAYIQGDYVVRVLEKKGKFYVFQSTSGAHDLMELDEESAIALFEVLSNVGYF